MEKIISIKESVFTHKTASAEREYAGIVIKTNMQEILFGICTVQSCCESFGFISCEDEYTKFIGADLRNIQSTDLVFDKTKLKITEMSEFIEIDDCIFLDVETDKGTLQFVVYNSHGGNYGHNVIVSSHHLTMEDYI